MLNVLKGDHGEGLRVRVRLRLAIQRPHKPCHLATPANNGAHNCLFFSVAENPMDTRLLKMFCAVADSASLVTAAARLHLTPSAISHGIKTLETELGCRLFERGGKKLLLNQAGEQLLAQVREPLAALDAAGEALKRLGQWGQTRLRLGASASSCQYLLPGVIRELKKSFAHLQLQIESGDTPEMVEQLRVNKLDLVLGVVP